MESKLQACLNFVIEMPSGAKKALIAVAVILVISFGFGEYDNKVVKVTAEVERYHTANFSEYDVIEGEWDSWSEPASDISSVKTTNDIVVSFESQSDPFRTKNGYYSIEAPKRFSMGNQSDFDSYSDHNELTTKAYFQDGSNSRIEPHTYMKHLNAKKRSTIIKIYTWYNINYGTSLEDE
jgi:hypothetical protein